MKNLHNSIYHLIKKLSKSEKRYFQLVSNLQDGEKQYMVLFNTIVDYPIEEQSTKKIEQEIMEELKNIIPKKRFSAVKQYLLKQLLQTLRLLHRKHSVDWPILQTLLDREIFLNKDLEKMAQKRLEKAREEAEKNERYYLLLHILDLELQYITEQLPDDAMSAMKNLHEIKSRVFKNLLVQDEYQSIHQEAYIIYKSKGSRKKENMDRANELLQHQLLQNIGEAQTFEAQVSAHNAKAILYNITGNYQGSNAAFRKIISIIESHPMMMKLYPRRYFVYLSNYLQSCHRLEKYDEFEEIWSKMNNVKPKNVDGQYEFKLKTAQSKLQIYLNTGNLQAAQQAATEVEEVIDIYSETSEMFRKTKESGSRYNLGMYYFVHGDFTKAREIFESLDPKTTLVKSDIQGISPVFEFLCWRELEKEEEFLTYLNNQTQRRLRKKDALFPFERNFLSLLAKIGRLPEGKERIKLLQQFLDNQMSQSQKEATRIRSKEEMKLWIKSKIFQRPMIDIFLEELEKRKNKQ